MEPPTDRVQNSTERVYRPYTTKFDKEVHAKDIDSVLGPLGFLGRSRLDQAWETFQIGLLPWKTQLHIKAAEAAARIRTALDDDERADTAVALLIDQSGSMRGQKMLFAAATADVVQEFLSTLNFTCEVLGFTTSKWRGGRSRRRWRWRFKPRYPGRLNDVLHIIYKSADDRRVSSGDWGLRQMLRPDLPKENIDGEALLWAAARLEALPQRRKVLIIISDGAPVDDSTIMQNGLTYLPDHLRSVVGGIVQADKIKLAAIAIGYQPNIAYPASSYIDAPDDLGHTLITLLERIVTDQR
jgi:cobaltochelatase CobT